MESCQNCCVGVCAAAAATSATAALHVANRERFVINGSEAPSLD
jgi:hypothetical protein